MITFDQAVKVTSLWLRHCAQSLDPRPDVCAECNRVLGEYIQAQRPGDRNTIQVMLLSEARARWPNCEINHSKDRLWWLDRE